MTEEKVTEKDIWEELRKPFPKESIGQLPKPYKSESPKGKCEECGGYHGLPAIHLDFVGHANVVDRLNSVVGPDDWGWEPMARDAQGSPALDKENNLWIMLTIHGATKPGVGDGKNMKERIGDAIRNAGMRFGIALDLWTKDELESQIDAPELKNEKPSEKQSTAVNKTAPGSLIHPALMKELRETLVLKDIRGDVATAFVQATIGRPTPRSNDDAQKIIDALKRLDPETGEFDAADAVGYGV